MRITRTLFPSQTLYIFHERSTAQVTQLLVPDIKFLILPHSCHCRIIQLLPTLLTFLLLPLLNSEDNALPQLHHRLAATVAALSPQQLLPLSVRFKKQRSWRFNEVQRRGERSDEWEIRQIIETHHNRSAIILTAVSWWNPRQPDKIDKAAAATV